MTEFLQALVIDRWAYVFTILLLSVGLYGLVMKKNLIKKLIGMNIFQTAVILFFIQQAYKHGGTVPIYNTTVGARPELYVNPLPHGLMLTAVVVSVATTGVALALLVLIHRRYETLNEDELLQRLRES